MAMKQTSPRQEIATRIDNILTEYEAMQDLLDEHDNPETDSETILSKRESEAIFIPLGRIKEAQRRLPDPTEHE